MKILVIDDGRSNIQELLEKLERNRCSDSLPIYSVPLGTYSKEWTAYELAVAEYETKGTTEAHGAMMEAYGRAVSAYNVEFPSDPHNSEE